MPHLILEYSANVIEPQFIELFQDCHTVLVNGLPAQLKDCKSRAIKCDTHHVGNGNPQNAFIHATLKIMPGRTAAVLQTVGQSLMTVFAKYFAKSVANLNLQISLEICELETHYFKTETTIK